jgi:hypothetical protein
MGSRVVPIEVEARGRGMERVGRTTRVTVTREEVRRLGVLGAVDRGLMDVLDQMLPLQLHVTGKERCRASLHLVGGVSLERRDSGLHLMRSDYLLERKYGNRLLLLH